MFDILPCYAYQIWYLKYFTEFIPTLLPSHSTAWPFKVMHVYKHDALQSRYVVGNQSLQIKMYKKRKLQLLGSKRKKVGF